MCIKRIYRYTQRIHREYTGGQYMLLELQNISKRLGSFRLEDISLQLPEGYILGLIGPNGAGKTSLPWIVCTG